MYWASIVSVALSLSAVADAATLSRHSRPKIEKCPPFNGTFSIDVFQLYSENSDFDPVHCKYYLSSNFNASVVVYDPYTADYQILTFPGITETEPYHMAGVDYDAHSGSMFFTATSSRSFSSNGADLSGPQKVIKWDTSAMKTVFIADLAPFQAEAKSTYGHDLSGFQDTAEDRYGNSYAPATFGAFSIAKITPDGTVSAFYLSNETPSNATAFPYIAAGLVSLPSHNKLVVSHAQRGTFVTFDTTSSSPVPTSIKISNLPSNYTSVACDGVIAPIRYNQSVILCADDTRDAITVFQSKDHWASAKYLGIVYNTDPETEGFSTTTAVEITDSIYIASIPFADGSTDGSSVEGNRSIFPFIDITEQVDVLVGAH